MYSIIQKFRVIMIKLIILFSKIKLITNISENIYV